MNIHHFESKIDKDVLARGYNYYIAGDILEVTSYGCNEYLFEIEGSELYEIEIKIDESGNILRSECDCPYNYGPICKHEVAAYYELQSIINDESNSETIQHTC